MEKNIRVGIIIILAVSIILSYTFIGNIMTDPGSYSHTIEVLDKNRETVLHLSAASAAASAVISALPTDICSPLAEQLSEFTTWFLLILSVVYLEKYLLTIFGFAACYFLIPIGCGALLVNLFFPKAFLQRIGIKLLIFGTVLLIAIPSSVWVSDQINSIYSQSIDITIESANAVTESLTEITSNDQDESTTVIDRAKTLLNDVSGSVSGIVDKFNVVLNRFIEATAVMLVTTCVIPVIIVALIIWCAKTLFGVQFILQNSNSNHRQNLSCQQ